MNFNGDFLTCSFSTSTNYETILYRINPVINNKVWQYVLKI